ncbi:MAG: DNA methyltransferase, partial [Candidatus Saccharimonadales bacterium]
MTQLSWNEIQDRATEFASKWAGETYEKGESQSFWSDFLNIYGVDRRRHGAFFEYAIKKGSGAQGFIDMFWPGKLLAEQKSGGRDLAKAGVQAYEYLETMPDHDLPEAIVVSDFASFQLINLDTRDKIEFTLIDLPKNVKLFGFLINQTSKHLAEESPVNRQAAESMARLHNQLRDDNYTGHDLEVLLVRLVFCLFADDSGIFEHGQLHEYLRTRTSDDGSDLGPRLVQIFEVLNTPIANRQSSLDESMMALPYVNGGLFAESIQTPYFNSTMRRDLLISMELDWSKVSPAIFGSMFQGVMDEKQRRNLGAHYTSEKNILRVIKPLFLDDLYSEFAVATAAGPRKKYDELRKLQDKIANLKFLDPACGSGNFLIISYRELRKLEHKIVAILAKNADQQDMFASAGAGVGSLKVNVDQMYGIEIEEFPSLIAQAALWLTDHQMNMEYSAQSGRTFKRLPLTHSATIVNDNALTKDWAEVIAPSELDYILGNPPFVGARMISADIRPIFNELFRNTKGV